MHVPYQELERETLLNLIESFITREGTDYGEHEVTLERKVAQVLKQLERGEAGIVFDEESETCNIVSLR